MRISLLPLYYPSPPLTFNTWPSRGSHFLRKSSGDLGAAARALSISPRGRAPGPRPLRPTYFFFGFKRVPDALAHAGGCGAARVAGTGRHRAQVRTRPDWRPAQLPEGGAGPAPRSSRPAALRGAQSAPQRSVQGGMRPARATPQTWLLHFSFVFLSVLFSQRTGQLSKRASSELGECLWWPKEEPSVTVSPCAAAKAQPRPRFPSWCVPQHKLPSPNIPLIKSTRGRLKVRAGDSCTLVCPLLSWPLGSSKRKEKLLFLHVLQ